MYKQDILALSAQSYLVTLKYYIHTLAEVHSCVVVNEQNIVCQKVEGLMGYVPIVSLMGDTLRSLHCGTHVNWTSSSGKEVLGVPLIVLVLLHRGGGIALSMDHVEM